MLHRLLFLIGIVALLTPLEINAQIIQPPDCNINPQSLFCQGQCRFNPILPWCAHPTPSPSPSPSPTKDPIIIVPGITVSQNKKLLYKDQAGGTWKFALGFNVYKGLIKKLESVGYEEGQDLFIAHYDWRKPAAHNAITYLKPIIDQAKQSTGANKVDVLAHSFGGIVTRSYVQSDAYGNDVDQLITLGSPHEGAADAYVAWEGGTYPEGWEFWMTNRINRIESALKRTRGLSTMRRPDSFRTFFPSLHDMLPLNDFVMKDGSLLSVANLTEQNQFLKTLHDTLLNISAKGVELFTIAGTNVNTLSQISVNNTRTREDEALNRWRDGHPNPENPPLDSTVGDARVLTASANVGDNNYTLNGTAHHKLPDASQDKVLEILGLDPVAEQFTATEPRSIFGIIILSPLKASIVGPNRQTLSQDRNDYGLENAEYDDDRSDPDDPIDITILNPPDGWYDITYTGTGEGEYTIITSYADEDETVSSAHDGNTTQGAVTTQRIYVGNSTITLVDDSDYLALLKEIERIAKQTKKDRLIKGHEQANITRPITHAQNDLRLYDQRTKQNRQSAALDRLRDYYQHLDEIQSEATHWLDTPSRATIANQILELLEKIRLSSPPL
ncbi:MAG TPA: hypothetical protein DDW41_05070 [Candidatus Andersenbacteria bacterium]|nr:MAG: PGAP1 family protein [Parcubacteria group bacterium GW2011_GWA2_45_14]HBE90553.1 hypothetical protein [Candidatus Andersenbacteria bacterium]